MTMKSEPRYIHYAGTYLKQGKSQGMEQEADYSLTGKGSGTYLYVAPVFDSGEEENTWQSLKLRGEFKDCKLEIVAAASDVDYRSVFADDTVDLEEKELLIRQMQGIRRVNAEDVLLTDLKGRFLYLFFKVAGQAQCSFTIRGAEVEFPKNSFLEYFPEVYQDNNDFFERYISIFQSMYMYLEKKVDDIPMRLDYEKAEYEDLLTLAEWVGLDEEIIKEAVRDNDVTRLRSLIANINEIQAGKGTKKALEQVLQILYGEDIHLLEYFKWYEYVENRPEELSLYHKLYGKDCHCLTIMIEGKKGHRYTEAERKSIHRVIETMLPIGMSCKLLILTESCHMDTHCYLDHNGALASLASANVGSMELYGNLVLQ